MALLKKDDNLFEESTMSFGDHLEELRVCLWFCVIWLFGGFCVGLYFGGSVVNYMQTPLRAALEKFYLDEGSKRLKAETKILKEKGYPDWVATIPEKTRMIPERFYVYPGQLEMMIDSRALVIDPMNENSLDLVDNLHALKKEKSLHEAKNRIVEAERYAKVQYSQDPKLLLLFRKVEDDSKLRSQALNFHESFSIYIKASFLLGFVIASPGIFYHVWMFVSAGLYVNERKYVYLFMPLSIGLFLAGTSLAFFLVFKYVLDFLLMFNAWLNIDPAPRINEWISFAIMLPVGFGISFQLPLVMFILERIGIFSVKQYMSYWKLSVMVIFFLSMILTPSDPWSMLLMAVPLTFLYFGGVGMCHLMPKRKSEFAEENV